MHSHASVKFTRFSLGFHLGCTMCRKPFEWLVLCFFKFLSMILCVLCLQTIVCVPTKTGVVELGSTDLVSLKKFRSLQCNLLIADIY